MRLIKLMGSTQEPADGQMDIKAPRESELPSDLFMTDDDCGGGTETKRKQLSLKETDLSLFKIKGVGPLLVLLKSS
jgi:hypothetical protein